VDFAASPSPADPTTGLAGPAPAAIGTVREIAGGASVCRFDLAALRGLAAHGDPAVRAAGQVGSQVKIRVGDWWLLGNVRDLRACDRDPGQVIAQVDFLGEGLDRGGGALGEFRRGVTRYPMPGDAVHAVTRADLRHIFEAVDRPHIEIGTVYPTEDVRASLLYDALLGKHFALLGSTGTGKSTSTALILHRIVEQAPDGHIVMLDPHGEYAAAFASRGMIFNVDNLNLPYWLMNFEEHCEVFITTEGAERELDRDILAKCLLTARGRSRIAQSLGKLTVDSPVPYLLSDLLAAIGAQMGKLEKAGELAPYMRLKTKVEELKSDPRYGFMFNGLLVSDTMAAFLAKIFRLPGDGKPISIIDLSGVPSDIVTVVVSVLSRLVFDHAIWSRNERRRPILLVCEEAHRYVPSDRSPTGAAVRKMLERIAKEGRKYGVALGLITQRPSDLAEGVLSQCGTIIAMRLNNDRDQAYVRSAMPEGARGFLDSIPALRNRECIVCGEGVPIPIRVRLDELAPQQRPASDDPLFSELWRESGGEAEMLERTIHRWRGQGR
jgi:DNA helicase HerA-like ATPase